MLLKPPLPFRLSFDDISVSAYAGRELSWIETLRPTPKPLDPTEPMRVGRIAPRVAVVLGKTFDGTKLEYRHFELPFIIVQIELLAQALGVRAILPAHGVLLEPIQLAG